MWMGRERLVGGLPPLLRTYIIIKQSQTKNRLLTNRFDRAAMLMALGLSGFAPIVHMALAEGIKGLTHFPLIHITIVCLCYILGTAFYVTRIPERYWPGTFDLWVSFLEPPERVEVFCSFLVLFLFLFPPWTLPRFFYFFLFVFSKKKHPKMD